MSLLLIGFAGTAAGHMQGVSEPRREAASEVIGVLGDIFGTVEGHLPDKDDPKDKAKEALTAVVAAFVNASDSPSHSLIQFFEDGDISSWPTAYYPGGSLPDSDTYKNNITKFMSDGRFMTIPRGSENENLNKALQKYLTTGMIMMALAQNDKHWYIIKDSYFEDDCEKEPSGKWINGHCYALHHPGPGWTGGDTNDPRSFTQAIAKDLADKMEKQYEVDLTEFYMGSEYCQDDLTKDYFDQETVPLTMEAAKGSDYDITHSCFFSLPVITVEPGPKLHQPPTWSSPCVILTRDGDPKVGYNYLPDELKKVFSAETSKNGAIGHFCDYECRGKGCQDSCGMNGGNRCNVTLSK